MVSKELPPGVASMLRVVSSSFLPPRTQGKTQQNRKLTEFYPVRRSSRKSKAELQVQAGWPGELEAGNGGAAMLSSCHCAIAGGLCLGVSVSLVSQAASHMWCGK